MKLQNYSTQRESLFNTIKSEMAPGTVDVCTLCPTRWTVRADAMKYIIQNYAILQELWEQAANIVHDTETIARIGGVASQMQCFDFFFGLALGEHLRHTDNLSRTLKKNCSASEGQVVADMTKKTLLHITSAVIQKHCVWAYAHKNRRLCNSGYSDDPHKSLYSSKTEGTIALTLSTTMQER